MIEARHLTNTRPLVYTNIKSIQKKSKGNLKDRFLDNNHYSDRTLALR